MGPEGAEGLEQVVNRPVPVRIVVNGLKPCRTTLQSARSKRSSPFWLLITSCEPTRSHWAAGAQGDEVILLGGAEALVARLLRQGEGAHGEVLLAQRESGGREVLQPP